MNALRLYGAEDLRLHEEPDARAGAAELGVGVVPVGLCGSDRHRLAESEVGGAEPERRSLKVVVEPQREAA